MNDRIEPNPIGTVVPIVRHQGETQWQVDVDVCHWNWTCKSTSNSIGHIVRVHVPYVMCLQSVQTKCIVLFCTKKIHHEQTYCTHHKHVCTHIVHTYTYLQTPVAHTAHTAHTNCTHCTHCTAQLHCTCTHVHKIPFCEHIVFTNQQFVNIVPSIMLTKGFFVNTKCSQNKFLWTCVHVQCSCAVQCLQCVQLVRAVCAVSVCSLCTWYVQCVQPVCATVCSMCTMCVQLL